MTSNFFQKSSFFPNLTASIDPAADFEKLKPLQANELDNEGFQREPSLF